MPTLQLKIWLPFLALSTACALPALARPVAIRTYDQLTAEAELVVIATPTAVRDTPERTDLPYITPGTRAIGVETTFEVAVVFKGELRPAAAGKPQTLLLHHYRVPADTMAIPNGPGLVTFDPKSRKQYLMFLKREADGRYQALSGQTDPDMSIEPLRHQR
jgi:hypothetical protein